MAGSVNKAIAGDTYQMYRDGMSLRQVSEISGVPVSTLRRHFDARGILRSRIEGVRMAAQDGRMGSGFRGKTREFTPEHCARIAEGRAKWGESNAAGVSEKTDGYAIYTRGKHKGRSVHVVKMELRIGRRLLEDECVHHIDGDKLNNDLNNLALVTRSGHARLHRREDDLAGKNKERNRHGQFC